MSVLTLYQEIKTHLREKLPKKIVKTVEFYAGEFDKKEIKASSFNAPCVLITIAGWQPSTDKRRDPTTGRDVRFAAFVVTKDRKGRNSRMLEAIALALLIESNLIKWCNPCAGKATNFITENLYSNDFDKQGLTLWIVTWWQSVELDPVNDVELFDFLQAGITHNAGELTVESTADVTGEP